MFRWNRSSLSTLRRLVERHSATVQKPVDGRYVVRQLPKYSKGRIRLTFFRLACTIGKDRRDQKTDEGWVEEFEIDSRWLTQDRIESLESLVTYGQPQPVTIVMKHIGQRRGNCRG